MRKKNIACGSWLEIKRFFFKFNITRANCLGNKWKKTEMLIYNEIKLGRYRLNTGIIGKKDTNNRYRNEYATVKRILKILKIKDIRRKYISRLQSDNELR